MLVMLMPALALLTVPVLDRLIRPGLLWKRLLAGGVLLLSFLVQLAASLVSGTRLEEPLYHALSEFQAATLLAEYIPFFTDPAMFPWTRLAAAIGAGRWDVLWMTQSGPDWLLLFVGAVAVAVGGLVLDEARAGPPTHSLRNGVIAQVGLSLSLVVLVLGRYPQAGKDMQIEQPLPPPELDQVIAALDEQAAPDDGILVILPYSYLGWMDRFDGHIPELGLMFENPLDARSITMLTRFSEWHPRVWLITEAVTAGDPANQADRWLAEHGFVGTEAWIGGYRIVPYTFSAETELPVPANVVLGDDVVMLAGYDYEVVERGDARWLNVWLRWEALTPPETDYTAFVHLIGPDGQVAAQHDGPPVGGYAPTSGWTPGSPVDDRHAVMLPRDMAPGAYRLQVGLYHPLTGERLPVSGGSDVVVLDAITIE
jgi:hypothetical protein